MLWEHLQLNKSLAGIYIIIIIIIIIEKDCQWKAAWERAINTLSVRRPQPHKANPKNETREMKNRRRQKGSEQQGQ